MKPNKTIMESHEAYINLLKLEVKKYAMSELVALEKRTRNSNAYRETNAVYSEEIKIRQGEISG